ncbi:MAG: MFS transporter [Xanthomonadales bacterium]|uniref:MFS transporter n=1 Tax=Dokdonella sp. TaxID=2291710 RepID=UPI002C66C953|nr:MFS transporter [Xanthomonadales bacterium]HQV73421.1 MFS transporter [Dokdonella sp.]MBK7209500.1 MFS transporter [Xanthomonadales bacterium]MBL0223291.1 MFS transporter [Xanthomonadales bacterium]HQW76527.1 MFS transporter [Dokdonella sp.]
MSATFRSLRGFNFRLWAAGAFVSNIGTWMQRTAQDWLVFAELTDRNATAVGIVMALQFGPPLLLLPLTGLVADHFDRRRVLMLTQTCMGLLALGLGLLTISGHAVLWHVHVFAFLLGCITAFDAPARQTFVSDLVTEAELSNAVALNSTSFNGARLVGPAVAGLLIAWIGTGWVFVLNAISFIAVIASLRLLRINELQRHARAVRVRGSLFEGFRYVWRRPDLVAILTMLFLIATFGLNFPIFVSMMSVTIFHGGPGQYGVLISTMAVGSVTGALLSARRARPQLSQLLISAIAFALSTLVAAITPNAVLFGLVLIIVGMSAQTFMTTSNSLVQLSTEPAMRGRVLAILLALALGGTPIGAPIVGWVADTFGARWSLGIGVAAGAAALLVGIRYLVRHRGLRVYSESGRWRITIDQGPLHRPPD